MKKPSGPRNAGYQGEGLRQADENRPASAELPHSLPTPDPPGTPENRPRDQESRRRNQRILEERFDRGTIEHTDERRWSGGERQEPEVPPSRRISSNDSAQEISQPGSVDDEDRDEGRHMNRHFEAHPRNFEPQQSLPHHQVPRARHGQELGRTLNEPEKESLPECHPRAPHTDR